MPHRNAQVVKASKDIMISFNGVDMKLTINSATTELSGTYRVVVSNEYGKDESSAHLVVRVNKNAIFHYIRDVRPPLFSFSFSFWVMNFVIYSLSYLCSRDSYILSKCVTWMQCFKIHPLVTNDLSWIDCLNMLPMLNSFAHEIKNPPCIHYICRTMMW